MAWQFRLAGAVCALVITTALPAAAQDIVLYAKRGVITGDDWVVTADGSAAGGYSMRNPNLAATKLTQSGLPSAPEYFELQFEANANTAYHLWIRGKAEDNDWNNDSVHVQFSDSVNSTGGAIYRIGTTGSAEPILEGCTNIGLGGWHWTDNGWCTTHQNGPAIYFASTGTHTIRVTRREDGIAIDQIVLSPATPPVAPGDVAPTADTAILAENPPPVESSLNEIVLYANDGNVVGGNWVLTPEANTAAGGYKMRNPNNAVPKISTAAASPSSYVEWTFQAQPNVGYRLWMRGRADFDDPANDSVHIQFSDSENSSGAAVYRIGSTASAEYVLEGCTSQGVAGWGWEDNGWCGGGALIYFDTSGSHTIRIQQREDGVSIDQIVLSASAYLSSAPGSRMNDTVIIGQPGNPTNHAPVITAGPSASPSSANTGTNISFSVTASDPDSGDTLSYLWEFGDGGTSTSASPTRAYSASSVYTVRVTVTDSQGSSVSGTTTVTIGGAPRTFTFMTWNIYKGRYHHQVGSTKKSYQCNLEEVASYIHARNVRMVSMNEVYNSSDPSVDVPSGYTNTYCSSVPDYKAMNGGAAYYDQFRILENLLEAKTGVSWTHKFVPMSGVPGGNLLLWRDDLADPSTSVTQRSWIYSNASNYAATGAGVTMTINSRQITFWSTHLIVDSGSSLASQRQAQVDELKGVTAAYGGYHVLAGDWNASTGEGAYTHMTTTGTCGTLCFNDAWTTAVGLSTQTPAGAGTGQTTRTTGSGARIDYVFVDKSSGSPLSILSASQNEPQKAGGTSADHISDHIPVVTTIQVN